MGKLHWSGCNYVHVNDVLSKMISTCQLEFFDSFCDFGICICCCTWIKNHMREETYSRSENIMPGSLGLQLQGPNKPRFESSCSLDRDRKVRVFLIDRCHIQANVNLEVILVILFYFGILYLENISITWLKLGNSVVLLLLY